MKIILLSYVRLHPHKLKTYFKNKPFVFSLTIAQFKGMLFDASSVYDQAPNIIMWIVVVGSWVALFLILWVFFTRNLNQRS